MNRKTDSLIFKIGAIFFILVIVAIGINGFVTYRVQYGIYEEQSQERLQNVAHYLGSLIEGDGEEFLFFRDNLIKTRNEIDLPLDFSNDYLEAKAEVDKLLAEKYPGRSLGYDLDYDELDDETKAAITLYDYKYWNFVFEQAREDFNVIYTYVVYPSEQEYYMYYIIDAARTPNERGTTEIAIEVEQVMDAHANMWEAWNTGKDSTGYDVYDNEFGKTYAFYSPLYINGEKAGVIGVEVEIAQYKADIMHDAIREMLFVGAIILITALIMLIFINNYFVRKLLILQQNVEEYSKSKNPAIAENIRSGLKGKNEIVSLGNQVANMIDSIEEYMSNLLKTSRELDETKEKAQALGAQAERDSLTGIRNRLAYDNVVKNIEWKIAQENFKEFGIAMIDLNFLKKINDTFGHEKGNISIQTICRIVCNNFKHSPVFRVGGDEFVVIIENEDYANIEALVKEFDNTLRGIAEDGSLEPWEKVSAAIGWTLFDPKVDNTVSNVFKRADELMYENKKKMRAYREG